MAILENSIAIVKVNNGRVRTYRPGEYDDKAEFIERVMRRVTDDYPLNSLTHLTIEFVLPD